MSFAQRAQASHSRMHSHFGYVSVVIRQGSGSGAPTMTVISRAPIPQMTTLEDGQEVAGLEIKFNSSDPGRTFVPRAGHWATLNGETYRVNKVKVHTADAVISYACELEGSQ